MSGTKSEIWKFAIRSRDTWNQGKPCWSKIKNEPKFPFLAPKVKKSRINERVIARTMQTDPENPKSPNMVTLGSELNGAFAQYVAISSSETFVINCKWTDVELASIPCSYSTAEGLLHRVKLGAEKIFINGASGGVGSAAIQLAKIRKAHITAQCSSSKINEIKKIGANEVVSRESDLIKELGKNKYDVVIDLVAGENWDKLLEILKHILIFKIEFIHLDIKMM